MDAADPSLYEGCTFILTPLARTSSQALDMGRAIAEAAGAHTLVLDAERQDVLVATLSHLPYLLACALVGTANQLTSPDPAAWEIVAGGYRDTSRVAGSDVTMMLDILLTNRDAVLQAMTACQSQLQGLAELVDQADEHALRQVLGTIRDQRREMFP